MSSNDKEKWILYPERVKVLFRAISLFTFSAFLFSTTTFHYSIIFILIASLFLVSRSIYSMPTWTVIIDTSVYIIGFLYNPIFGIGLLFSLFEFAVSVLWPISFFFFIAVVWLTESTTLYLIVVFLIFSFGRVIAYWEKDVATLRYEMDKERLYRYELEELKQELLSANVQIARKAELMERDRISQELHDHVGHELTAALLAMQAAEQLKEVDPKETEHFYKEALQRLKQSNDRLRDTVHNMKPIEGVNVARLEKLVKTFKFAQSSFHAFGDTSRISAECWTVFEPVLKESLTNVSKHGVDVSSVEVELDVGTAIARLSIKDDGEKNSAKGLGIGLRNLRQRAQALGGSLSINQSKGFEVICVLPIPERRRKEYECFDRG